MTAPVLSPAEVVALVEEAARPIPLLWPLGTAVAANPLWDLRDAPFPLAVARARQVLGIGGLPEAGLLSDAFRAGRITAADLAGALAEMERRPGAGPAPLRGTEPEPDAVTLLEDYDRATGGSTAGVVDREVAKYCAAFLAGLLPAGTGAEVGFFASWRLAIGDDPAARRLHLCLLAAPGDGPEEAIARTLAGMELDEVGALRELSGQLARLPGWASHAKWRSRWAAPDHRGPALHLADYLAVRLCYDLAALSAAGPRPGRRTGRTAGPPARTAEPSVPDPGLVGGPVGERLAGLTDGQAGWVWLSAYEGHYRDRLLATLDRPAESVRPLPALRAQVVCCIDARSEGLRRHLEAIGGYETFGFAGFFGVPARLWPWTDADPLDLCPVLLRPTVELGERPADAVAGEHGLAALRQFSAADRAVATVRKKAVAPYLVAEAGGLGLGPLAVLRTSAPTKFARLRRVITDRLTPSPPVEPVLDGPGAPSDAEQALYAETALRTMGLTEGFAPVVVLCGHGSSTENNPYASALDCGACGAAPGGRSALLAAAILNRPAVRSLLAGRGITIGDHTVFVAAEHDTATDTVTVHAGERLDPAGRAELARIEADLARAGTALATERAAELPGAPGERSRHRRHPADHVAVRSTDWAQVQPEWGLARCAAFIVGPRRLTAGVDLERRAFLHSYEPDSDPEGTALETILTGPMVVAQWISAAYYHSTVDPDILGAGDKVAHNVVAGMGVYQGAGGDLKLGLPRQAVFDRDRAHHEPMRLLVVVAAPRTRIDEVIARNPVLGELIDGEWVHLAARDTGRFWRRGMGGDWQAWPGRAGSRTGSVPPDQATSASNDRAEVRQHG